MKDDFSALQQDSEVLRGDVSLVRVNMSRFPPGFQTTDLTGEEDTPVANPTRPPTPAFQHYQPNRESQLWQGYFKTYEQEMQAQLKRP